MYCSPASEPRPARASTGPLTGRLAAAVALAAALALPACGGTEQATLYDFDLDGALDQDDCSPADPAIHPGAEDSWGDGIDQDCDGSDGVDGDRDGHASLASGGDDCNDTSAGVHPGAAETPANGIDEDCSGGDLVCDLDGDGLQAEACDGLDCDDADPACGLDCGDSDGDEFAVCQGDCDDSDAARSPAAPEVCDGLDDDCDGALLADELDTDGDGARLCDPVPDCDDADPLRFPGQPEACDGLDGDCDPATAAAPSEDDVDGDSDPACSDCADGDPVQHSLNLDGDPVSSCDGDCDDDNPLAFPGAPDGALDGVDNNCDGVPGVDGDEDGYAGEATGGADCDDEDDAIHPAAPEVCDGVDQDCDGQLDNGFDVDGDGVTTCAGDCDDDDGTVLPGADELCDGLDGDCDGTLPPDELDGDADGAPGCDDCDDGAPGVYPGAAELCDGVDQDCDAVVDEGFEVDGDGLTSCDGDCDDDNAFVLPGAPEVCDGLDTDCDPATGDAASETDSDEDGWLPCPNFTDHGGTNAAGTPLVGGEDCDDAAAFVNPGAAEECDGLDGDCDGGVSAAPAEVDVDGDGWMPCTAFVDRGVLGADGLPLQGADDCDDLDQHRNPGLAEVCDGLDNDCDAATTVAAGEEDGDSDRYLPCAGFVAQGGINALGQLLLGGDDCADDEPLTWPGNLELCDGVDDDCDPATVPVGTEDDADGDGYVACAGYVAVGALGVGGNPLLGGQDCDDLDPAQVPGSWESPADGFDASCDGFDGTSLSWAGVELLGERSSDLAGYSVAGGGDFDGDGLADLLIGASQWDRGPGTGGAALVVAGSSLADGMSFDLEDAHATFHGEDQGDQAGRRVAWAGDVDGDGLDDILVAKTFSWSNPSRAYLVLGSTLSEGGTSSLADADLIFDPTTSLLVGTWVAGAGDVDGDGLGDVFVSGAGSTGVVYLFTGADLSASLDEGTDTVLLSEAHARFDAEASSDQGWMASEAGDVDGDGLGDLLFGAYGHDGPGVNSGRAYLYFGATVVAGGDLPLGSADILLNAEAGNHMVGKGIAAAGDVDGDGLGDLLISAPSNSAIMQGAGKIYVVLAADLPASGSYPLALSHASIYGTFVNAYPGYPGALAGAGDVDGDGLSDILIGVTNDDEGGMDAGKAHLFFGATLAPGGVLTLDEADVAFVGEVAGDWAAHSLDGAGDVDGDGLDDFLVGAQASDQSGANAGQVHLMLSPY